MAIWGPASLHWYFNTAKAFVDLIPEVIIVAVFVFSDLQISKECFIQEKEPLPDEYNQCALPSKQTKLQRRQANPSPFSSCEVYTDVHLESGVHPAGATSSSVAFGFKPIAVQRGDTDFWRYRYEDSVQILGYNNVETIPKLDITT